MGRALFIGDPIQDAYVICDMTRLNPEGPSPLLDEKEYLTHNGGVYNVFESCSNILNNREDIELCLLDAGIHTVQDVKTRYVVNNTVLLRSDHRPPDALIKRFGQEVVTRFVSPDNFNTEYDIIVVSDYGKGAITGDLMDALVEYKTKFSECFICVDPKSIDSRLFGNPEWLDVFDLIKPNKACFDKADPKLLCNLKTTFVISQGDQGVRVEEHHLDGLYTTNEIMAERPDGSIVDPCSCGDSLFAGIVCGFLLELQLCDSVRLGNFLAARTASHMGSYHNTYEEARYFLTNRLRLDEDILKGDADE